MATPLSQKSSLRLFLWGMVLIPFAVVPDAVLDAVIFGNESVQEQLLSPTYHEVAIRFLFCTFILAAIYLGMHYLAKSAAQRSGHAAADSGFEPCPAGSRRVSRQPLRELRQTSASRTSTIELLRSQCSHSFDEKTRFFMESIYNSSARLNEQLDINMALTEFAGGEPHRERVRLDQLAEEVVDELRKKRPGRELEFKIQPWLTAWCDRKMLRLIIYNLFCNAIDFIPETRKGRIDFGMFNRNQQKVFFVRDNGTGYTDAQAKRLFDAFQDNPLDKDLPRDSITLANTRRVINRHNGQIWAEGIEGAGGTVFFTCNTPG